MAILAILKYPNPSLKKISKPVTIFNDDLKQLAANMIETMFQAPGAGLAAPQVGKLIRLIVVDISPENEYGSQTMILVNPKIIEESGQFLFEEGCLSILDYNDEVCRFEKVTVKAQNLEGQEIIHHALGRQAVILQHEIDHLNGILFIDHLSSLKRNLYRRRLKKVQRQENYE